MVDGLTIFAWFVMAVLFLAAVWLTVAIGSLPKKIAVKRNHPQVDAINAASWIGLFAGGAGWIIAFVWAFLRSGEVGHAGQPAAPNEDGQGEIAALKKRIAELEAALHVQQSKASRLKSGS